MLRYYVIATVLVLTVGCIGAAIHFGGGRELRVASVRTTASPSPPRAQAASTLDPGAITGAAPWIFSALTDCFHEKRVFHGSLEVVRRHLPAGAQALPAGTVIRSGPCQVYLARDEARAVRGPASDPSVDARIPPHLQVFVAAAAAQATSLRGQELFVVRWSAPQEARLDRLSTTPNATLRAGR